MVSSRRAKSRKATSNRAASRKLRTRKAKATRVSRKAISRKVKATRSLIRNLSLNPTRKAIAQAETAHRILRKRQQSLFLATAI